MMHSTETSDKIAGMDARFWLVAGLILIAALARVMPHPPNFAPVAAMALFGGAMFRNKLMAFAAPLTAMLLSDIVIEMTMGWGFYDGQWINYAAFVLVTALGLLLRSGINVGRVAGAAVGSSLLFFFISNLGPFFYGTYEKSLGGLLLCYEMALPFLQMTMLGDLAYSAALFGGFALLMKTFPQLGIRSMTPVSH